MSPVALVVARAANGVIGAGGRIPWRIPEDVRRFKRLTLGKPCIMGRKTWESLPRKPLVDRLNIVVTRDAHFIAPEAVVARSFDEACVRAQQEKRSEIAVIGGAAIYEAALPVASIIHLTEVHAAFEGDTLFPWLASAEWREVWREERETTDELRYAFVTLERA